jgi:hypothetical protein
MPLVASLAPRARVTVVQTEAQAINLGFCFTELLVDHLYVDSHKYRLLAFRRLKHLCETTQAYSVAMTQCPASLQQIRLHLQGQSLF